jgi:hypothetical protein
VLIDVRDERGRFLARFRYSAAEWAVLRPLIQRSGKTVPEWFLDVARTAAEQCRPQPRKPKAQTARSKAGNYARTEYEATAKELAAFVARADAELAAERRAGTMRPYRGNLAALVLRRGVTARSRGKPAGKGGARPGSEK